jgi:ADP-ribose pyrophosphatase YjhB (NUDIX family)
MHIAISTDAIPDGRRQSDRAYSHIPRLGVGALVVKRNAVLLVRRKFPPAQGQWSLPGGLVEWGETCEQAVKREVAEECGLIIKPLRLLEALDFIERDEKGDVRFHYVLLDYLAKALSEHLVPGSDVEEVQWFPIQSFLEIELPEITRSFLKRHFEEILTQATRS